MGNLSNRFDADYSRFWGSCQLGGKFNDKMARSRSSSAAGVGLIPLLGSLRACSNAQGDLILEIKDGFADYWRERLVTMPGIVETVVVVCDGTALLCNG